MKFYIQDDTQKKQITGIENVSPAFDQIEWNTEDSFDILSGKTVAKKTVQNQTEFTFTMVDINQSSNEGFAMAKLYAEEEGDKEEVFIIAEADGGGEKLAIKGVISKLTGGDYNNALRKPTFTLKGNPCEVPSDPA